MTYSAPHAGLVKAIVSFSQSLRSSTRNNDFYFHFFFSQGDGASKNLEKYACMRLSSTICGREMC